MSGAHLEEGCGSWERSGEAAGAGGQHITTLFLRVGRETPPSLAPSLWAAVLTNPEQAQLDMLTELSLLQAPGGLGWIAWPKEKKKWGPSPWALKGTSKLFFGGGRESVKGGAIKHCQVHPMY